MALNAFVNGETAKELQFHYSHDAADTINNNDRVDYTFLYVVVDDNGMINFEYFIDDT